MKKQLFLLIVCTLALAFPVQGLAADLGPDSFESAAADPEYSQLEALGPKIVQEVNNILQEDGRCQMSGITLEDVDWTRAYRLYIDADLYALNTDSTEEILAFLSTSSYMWQLPIEKGEGTVLIHLSRGSPLSDEAKELLTTQQQEEVTNNIGKWTITRISFDPEIPSYKDKFTTLLGDGAAQGGRNIILGGMSKIRSVVGLTLGEQTAQSSLILEAPLLTVQPNPRARNAVGSLSKDQQYPFSQMAATIPLDPGTRAAGWPPGLRRRRQPPDESHRSPHFLRRHSGGVRRDSHRKAQTPLKEGRG